MSTKIYRFITMLSLMVAPLTSLTATTVASHSEKQMQEMRAAMLSYERQHGELPSGENRDIVAKLAGVGLQISAKQKSPDGSYLDDWGNPFYFLRTSDGIVILSLGEKAEGGFPRPMLLLVKSARERSK